MRIQNKMTLASTLFSLISFVSFAQEGPPPPMPPPPPGLPIDGPVLVVLVLALAYGVKKMLDIKKKVN